MVRVDQIIGRIGKERRALASCSPLAGRIRVRGELRRNRCRRAKGGIRRENDSLDRFLIRLIPAHRDTPAPRGGRHLD